ncbi:hypothetical protein X801_03503, partial [Opisthorchis viverrini]
LKEGASKLDESSLKEKQPALIGHTAGHHQPPDLTQSEAYSSSVNIAVHSEYSSSTVLDQIVPLRRKSMVLYSVHLNRQLAAASSQAALDDVQQIFQFGPDYQEQDILTVSCQDISDTTDSQNHTTACIVPVSGTNHQCCCTAMRFPNN